MRKIGLMQMLGAGVMAVAAAMAQRGDEVTPGGPGGFNTVQRRHKGKGRNTTRGKGKQAKPRKRPNMKIVSKRVRRKHRRAA